MDCFWDWDEEKNSWLKSERGICFEDIVLAVHEGKILDIIKHPNQEKYPDQYLYIIEIFNYVYIAPYIREKNTIFLKTIIPSRKMKKLYKG